VSTPKALYVCIWPSCPWKGIGFVHAVPVMVAHFYPGPHGGRETWSGHLVRCQRCGRACRVKQYLTEVT